MQIDKKLIHVYQYTHIFKSSNIMHLISQINCYGIYISFINKYIIFISKENDFNL